MADNYGTVVTAAGRELINMAIASGQPLALTTAGLGSGNWADGESRETLKNKRVEVGIQQISAGQNPLSPILRVIVPSSVGGFNLTELAVYTPEGAVFAITRYPITYLPAPGTQPVASDLDIDLVLPVGEADVIQLIIDPGLTATREWVAGQLLAESTEADDKYSPVDHSHSAPAWSDVNEKPASFPPAAHNHDAPRVQSINGGSF